LINEGAPRFFAAKAVFVFICADSIAEADDIAPVLQAAYQVKQDLLIISPDISGAALGTMIVNKKNGTVRSCAIRAPKSGEWRVRTMEDIAIATGGKVFSSDSDSPLREMTPDRIISYFGSCSEVCVTGARTILTDGHGDEEAIAAHIEQLRSLVETDLPNKQRHQERLATITGKIGAVMVPGYNTAEKAARRFIVEDGIYACMSALRGGVIPGGGCGFKKMIEVIKATPEPTTLNGLHAKELLLGVLRRPMELLIANAVEGGIPGPETYRLLNLFLSEPSDSRGIDIRTLQMADLKEAGVWEPALVPLTAMRLAFSCATTIGNTKAMILQQEKA